MGVRLGQVIYSMPLGVACLINSSVMLFPRASVPHVLQSC